MTDPIKQDPIIKPMDMHATSEPALDAITDKVIGGQGESIVTKDMHATTEPAMVKTVQLGAPMAH